MMTFDSDKIVRLIRIMSSVLGTLFVIYFSYVLHRSMINLEPSLELALVKSSALTLIMSVSVSVSLYIIDRLVTLRIEDSAINSYERTSVMVTAVETDSEEFYDSLDVDPDPDGSIQVVSGVYVVNGSPITTLNSVELKANLDQSIRYEEYNNAKIFDYYLKQLQDEEG